MKRQFIRNYRLAFLIALLFAGWVSFFDAHSLLKRYRYHQTIEELTRSKKEYEHKIQSDSTQIELLKQDDAYLEEWGREKFQLVKEGEKLIIVE